MKFDTHDNQTARILYKKPNIMLKNMNIYFKFINMNFQSCPFHLFFHPRLSEAPQVGWCQLWKEYQTGKIELMAFGFWQFPETLLNCFFFLFIFSWKFVNKLTGRQRIFLNFPSHTKHKVLNTMYICICFAFPEPSTGL